MNNNVKRKTKDRARGITLIALVITIVIMLILAGVAISMAIDSNGLFSKANTAGESWNTAVADERSEIQNLLDILGVDEPGDLPVGWESSKIASTVTETSTIAGTTKERIVPIPKGYVASEISTEATIAGGLVVYEETAPVTGEKNSAAHVTAMTTRNQYVWIPVDDINYMVMCKSNNKVADASGNKTCNLVLQTNGTLKCVTHDSTDLCGRVYSTTSSNTTVDSKTVYTRAMSFTNEERASQTWNTSNYHEPNIVSSYDKDSNTSYLEAAGVSSASQLATQLANDFTAMATSVAKYGGFYVSRYEAGANGASKKNQKVLVAGNDTTTTSDSNTYIGVNDKDTDNMWYGLYNTLRNNTGVDTNVVNTHMIWGSQYDQIINFLGTNPNNEPQKAHTNRQLATQKLTGSNEADVMSNIYDLEGNNFEWTAQANSTDNRAARGGSFNFVEFNRFFFPASVRYKTYPDNNCCRYASRCALYIR